MGGGGGGGSTIGGIGEILAAAEQKLRQMASEATRILFICENEDVEALSALAAQLEIRSGVSIQILTPEKIVRASEFIAWSSLNVVFVSDATNMTFIDKMVDAVLGARKTGICIKAKHSSVVPSKVGAYRWRVLSWQEFADLLK